MDYLKTDKNIIPNNYKRIDLRLIAGNIYRTNSGSNGISNFGSEWESKPVLSIPL